LSDDWPSGTCTQGALSARSSNGMLPIDCEVFGRERKGPQGVARRRRIGESVETHSSLADPENGALFNAPDGADAVLHEHVDGGAKWSEEQNVSARRDGQELRKLPVETHWMSPSHQSALCGISSLSVLGELRPVKECSRYSVMDRVMLQRRASVGHQPECAAQLPRLKLRGPTPRGLDPARAGMRRRPAQLTE
jgi:hypothetical protein